MQCVVVCARLTASAVLLRAIFTNDSPCIFAGVVVNWLGIAMCLVILFVPSLSGDASMRALRSRYHKSYLSMSGLPMIISYGKLLNTLHSKGTMRASGLFDFSFLLSLHCDTHKSVGMVI